MWKYILVKLPTGNCLLHIIWGIRGGLISIVLLNFNYADIFIPCLKIKKGNNCLIRVKGNGLKPWSSCLVFQGKD